MIWLCPMETLSKSNKKSKLWGAADTYERYMGRWSRKVAPLFVDWLDASQEQSWADIGCGTGELSLQIASKCKPSHLVGIDTSAAFITQAAKYVPSAEFREGDATNIDLPDEGLDYAVSGLVLNFVPDKAKALSEMARIVRPGGVVALYVWDYAGHMQIMRYFSIPRALSIPIHQPMMTASTHQSVGQSLFWMRSLRQGYPTRRQLPST